MRLREAKVFYLESLHQRRMAVNSIHCQECGLKNFMAYCAGIGLGDVRNATLETLLGFKQWLSSRRKSNGKSLSISYQNKCMWATTSLFRYLFEQERILKDITRHVPMQRHGRSLPRDILSKEQVTRLLQQPNLSTAKGFRDRTALEVLYSCALRIGELCKLTAYDIDLKERTVRVVQGKGRKDRLVPIGKIACQYLEAYMKSVYPVLQKKQVGTKTALTLFLMDTCRLRVRFKKLCLAAKLPDTLSVHSLRHTCATELLRGGASIRHVQELLGHSCITTTQIYTHVAIDDLQKAHKKSAPSERRTKDRFIPFNSKTAAWRQDKPKRKRK